MKLHNHSALLGILSATPMLALTLAAHAAATPAPPVAKPAAKATPSKMAAKPTKSKLAAKSTKTKITGKGKAKTPKVVAKPTPKPTVKG